MSDRWPEYGEFAEEPGDSAPVSNYAEPGTGVFVPQDKDAGLRKGEKSTSNYIRLANGEIKKAQTLRIIGQSLSVWKSGDFEYVALPDGKCVPLPMIEEFAGTTTDPIKLQDAANNFHPPDVWDPEDFPSPPPTSYPVTTVTGEKVEVIEKIADKEKASSYERLLSKDGKVYVALDTGNKVVLREVHKKVKPEMYSKPNQSEDKGSSPPTTSGTEEGNATQ